MFRDNMKVRKILATLISFSFFVQSVPAFANQSLKNIDQIYGGQGGGTAQEGQTLNNVYFGCYWQNNASGYTPTGSAGSPETFNTNNYDKDGIKWRVLSNSDGALMMISDQSLYADKFNDTASEHDSNIWNSSSIRSTLNSRTTTSTDSTGSVTSWGGFAGDAFTDKEYGYIKEDSRTIGGVTSTEKIYILSKDTATNSSYGFPTDTGATSTRQLTTTELAKHVAMYGNDAATATTDGVNTNWWQCTPGHYNSSVYVVGYTGGFSDGNGVVDRVDTGFYATRPALNINSESLLFASAAEGGKGAVAVGDGFAIADYTGTEYKLTLRDTTIATPGNITVSQTIVAGETVDGIAMNTSTGGSIDLTGGLKGRYGDVKVSYVDATTGTNMYVSALAANSLGDYVNYAKIANASTESSATNVSIGVSQLADGEYTMYLFGEQANDAKQTDYASNLSSGYKIRAGNSSTKIYEGTLSSSYATKPLTANLGNGFNLSFENAVYDTSVTVAPTGATVTSNNSTIASLAVGGNTNISGNLAVTNVTRTDGVVTVNGMLISDTMNATGTNNKLSALGTTATGANNIVSGADSTANGTGNNNVSGTNSIAMGTGHIVSGNNSGAIGDPNVVVGSGSYAIGNDNYIGGDNTFVMGNNVNTSTYTNSVVLGNGSAVNQSGIVSVGSESTKRKIINVADGVADSDVATVGQLKNASGGSIDYIAASKYNGTGANAGAVASGTGAGGATAVGYGSNATANYATAIGYGASSTHENSVALGKGSCTSETNEFSVGSSTQTRKISNVTAVTPASGGTYAATTGQVYNATLTQGAVSGTGNNEVTLKNAAGTALATVDLSGLKTTQGNTLESYFETGTGVAKEATKATKDGNGDVITTTYAKSADVYTKTDANATFAAKSVETSVTALQGNFEADGTTAKNATNATNDGAGQNIASTYATVTALGAKANASEVYKKTETYSQAETNSAISTAVGIKANISDVYNKTETYNRTETESKIASAISGDINTATITTTGNATFGGNVSVTGTSTFTGLATFNAGANMNNQKITNVAAGGTSDSDAVNYGQVKKVLNAYVSSSYSGNILSLTKADGTSDSYTISGGGGSTNAVEYDGATKDVVTLKGTSGKTKITKLANGEISADSTDAVNGSQLSATNTRVTTAEGKIGTLETKMTAAEGNIGTLQSDMTAVKGDVSTLSGKVTTAEGKIGTIETKVTAAEGNISTLQSDMTTVQGDVSTLSGKVTTAEGKIGTLETKMTTAEGNISTLQSDMTTVKSDVSGVKSDVSTLKTEMGTVKTDVSGLKSDMTSVKSDVTNLGTRVTTAEGNITTLQSDMGTAKTDITNIKTDVTNVKTEITNVKTDVTNLQSDMTTVQSSVTNLDTRVTTTENKVQEIATKGTDIKDASGNETKVEPGKITVKDGAGTGTTTITSTEIKTNTVTTNTITTNSVNSKEVVTDKVTVGGDTYITAAGIDANSKTITNVADAVNPTDAVNKGQLDAATTYKANGVIFAQASGIDFVAGEGVEFDTTGGKLKITSTGGVENEAVKAYKSAGDKRAKTAEVQGATAIGYNSEATSMGATAIGYGNKATGERSTAVGYRNEVSGVASGAFGDPNIVSGSGSYAIGNNNEIKGNNTFVLGSNVKVDSTVKNSVALGNGSTVTESNVVSVGSTGNERKITNVASGKNDTDAVNMSQLNATNATVANLETGLNDTNSRVTNIQNQVAQNTQETREVGAMSAALAGLHYVEPTGEGDDKFTGAVAYGGFRGESAAALGVAYKPSPNLMVSASTSVGNSQNMYNAGVAFKFGPGKTINRAALQKQVKYLNDKVEKMGAENADLKGTVQEQNVKIEQQSEMIKTLLNRLEKLEKKVK